MGILVLRSCDGNFHTADWIDGNSQLWDGCLLGRVFSEAATLATAPEGDNLGHNTERDLITAPCANINPGWRPYRL